MKAIVAALGLSTLLAVPQQVSAWGDEGYMAVALIAAHYLEPAVKTQIDAMLAADTDGRTKHDLASAATWADRWRADHYEQTELWHYVDMEIGSPDLKSACFGRSPLPAGVVALDGPPKACVVDKIKQFAAELASPSTDPEERIVALKFVLHFVGDVHQPLHSSDNRDRGGNEVRLRRMASSTMHVTNSMAIGTTNSSRAWPSPTRLLHRSCWRRSRPPKPQLGLQGPPMNGRWKPLQSAKRTPMATRRSPKRCPSTSARPMLPSPRRTSPCN
jgi:hypothetical protein